ncbi:MULTISPECIES: hypothetical protein [unclassified Cryobacterium]|uniref:hypothetical protein n=1 Tax=unclassified Cryobacterium TaxID=2649013 RepID=UPI000CE2CE88|nr:MULTISPECIES: hypothetical protein [unclassified Cryobacterium]
MQNSFPNSQVGTATASNNYFRQIGASIGSAVVGNLFAARLTEVLTERMPAGAAGAVNSFTPAMVRDLPEAARQIIIGGYNDALTGLPLSSAAHHGRGHPALLRHREAARHRNRARPTDRDPRHGWCNSRLPGGCG